MFDLISTLIMISVAAWLTSFALTRHNSKKKVSFKEVSKGRMAGLSMILNSPGTKPFLISAIITMIGIGFLGDMMHGNLEGIVYPGWQIAIGFILVGQFIFVEVWYLLLTERISKNKK